MTQLKAIANTLTSGGTTPLDEALAEALNSVLLNAKPDRMGSITLLPRIILFNDGVPDNPAEVKKMIYSIKNLSIAIRIVCIGIDRCDDALLRWISYQTGGAFFKPYDLQEVSTQFMIQALLPAFIHKHSAELTHQICSRPMVRKFYDEQGIQLLDAEAETIVNLVKSVVVVERPEDEEFRIAPPGAPSAPPMHMMVDPISPQRSAGHPINTSSFQPRMSIDDDYMDRSDAQSSACASFLLYPFLMLLVLIGGGLIVWSLFIHSPHYVFNGPIVNWFVTIGLAALLVTACAAVAGCCGGGSSAYARNWSQFFFLIMGAAFGVMVFGMVHQKVKPSVAPTYLMVYGAFLVLVALLGFVGISSAMYMRIQWRRPFRWAMIAAQFRGSVIRIELGLSIASWKTSEKTVATVSKLSAVSSVNRRKAMRSGFSLKYRQSRRKTKGA
eukprot:NODE_124_length_3251_cov_72.985294_g115_i0.p1 GENE.NODE_124_length_3251_cov_72.985294_g115_i0~~NODE_124_length_3251_cov_72.985294_g115_i0.p1  ORF type:complete len:441 (-),score=28.42 NODE_124_length_3251_cov_72.985294_g115_i0:1636-2958(-)